MSFINQLKNLNLVMVHCIFISIGLSQRVQSYKILSASIFSKQEFTHSLIGCFKSCDHFQPIRMHNFHLRVNWGLKFFVGSSPRLCLAFLPLCPNFFWWTIFFSSKIFARLFLNRDHDRSRDLSFDDRSPFQKNLHKQKLAHKELNKKSGC